MRDQMLAMALAASASIAAAQPAPDKLANDVRRFAEATLAGVAPSSRDIVLIFGRDQEGTTVVTGVASVPKANGQVQREKKALAILRTRSENAAEMKSPDNEDFRFAQTQASPVFIAGGWSKPATIWQIGTLKGQQRYRVIGLEGVPGPWIVVPSDKVRLLR